MNTITVLSGLTLAARIAAGNYDGYINPSITEENFLHDPTTAGEWEYKLFQLWLAMSYKMAVDSILVGCYEPAKMDHLLTFGEKFPEEQCQGPIIGLGTLNDSRQGTPGLSNDGLRRRLKLYDRDTIFSGHCRFLGVRRMVSKA